VRGGIGERIGDAAPNVDLRREVEHHIRRRLFDDRVDAGGRDVLAYQAAPPGGERARQVALTATGQVVQDHDLAAVGDHTVDQMRSDESSATGDHSAHDSSFGCLGGHYRLHDGQTGTSR